MLRHVQLDGIFGDACWLVGRAGAIKAPHVGHERFDDEHAAEFEMRRHVAKAPHLLRLCEQREEGIEDDEDKIEIADDGYVCEVAERDGDLRAAGLSAQALDHLG